MQIEYCEQRSTEWLSLRLGIPTGSNFSKIVTSSALPSTSQARQTYIYELAAERLTRTLQDHFVGPAAERGIALEPRARAWYSMQTDQEVEQVGLVFPDGHRDWGVSPDGLTQDGGLEIKCQLRAGHVEALVNWPKVPARYWVQIQSQLWITGREQWAFVAYTEDRNMPSKIWTVKPDLELHKAFEKHLPAFVADVEKITEKLREVAG